MKIRQDVIERLNGRDDLKRKLRSELNADRFKIWRWLRENSDNGPLTTLKALTIISMEFSTPMELLVTDSEKENLVSHEN